MSNVYLVTGANSGLGLDSVRRLALMPSTKTVFMACRSELKAKAAVDSLDKAIDRTKLKYVHFDASESKDAIFQTAESLDDASLHGVLLNAGGLGHDKTQIHQINLIGHVQLVEALKPKLAVGCKIVFSGSEAARGVPMMMIGKPKLGDTSDWYTNQLEKDVSKKDPMAIYAKTKGFAALYFAEFARRNPEYTVLVVSPGGTSGTEAMKADAVPAHFKFMIPVMMPMMKAMGVMHDLDKGTDRYIDGLTGEYDKYPSGTFIASKRGTTGAIEDQTKLRSGKVYADQQKQQAAFEALSAYTQVA